MRKTRENKNIEKFVVWNKKKTEKNIPKELYWKINKIKY